MPAGPGAPRARAAVSDRAPPGLRAVDLALRGGRITGLAGVSGNGQAALADLDRRHASRPAAGEMRVARRAGRARLVAARRPRPRHRPHPRGPPPHRLASRAMSLTENAILEAYAPRRRSAAAAGSTGAPPQRLRRGASSRDYDVRCPGPRGAHRRCSRAATCRS